jgi:RHS repeat-associated protein
LERGAQDKLFYFHANHLGSGSLITDNTGKTYQTLAYAPYGESLVNIRHYNSYYYNEPHQFTGYERDEESGMSYAHARYYDDNLRFISTDAMWWKYPMFSPYNLCANNPINLKDADGNQFPFFFGGSTPFMLGTLDPVMLGTAEPIVMTSKPVVPESVMQLTRVAAESSPKIEWHHLIPKQLFNEAIKTLKQAIKEGFKKDGAGNKIPVEKFVKDTGKGQHGNHPKFTDYVRNILKNFEEDNPNATGKDAMDFLQKTITDIKQTIK